jgi:RNA polymerase sigma-70 factor (ECF subfamily)
MLLNEVRSGNTEAFTVIVERYRQQVARTVIGMLGHTSEADDVGQEVFIRLYKSIDKFRGEAALSTYLTRIAINLSLNALKKQKRQRLYSSFTSNNEDDKRDQLQNLANYDDEHEANDTQELVQLALQKLDPKFRSVIVLRMLEGFSTKETAHALNLPLGTVLSRLTRAQSKLRIELKELGYETARIQPQQKY